MVARGVVGRARAAAPALQAVALHAAMAALLLMPAVWNGFPFVFADTGGYLLRPFAGTLELGRSALYGTFLAASIPLNFWPAIVIQALLVAWIVNLVLRAQGLARPSIAIAVVAALCTGTSLPWYAGQLMPDVFVPLAVLALYLTAFAPQTLRRWEIAGLAATMAFAIAFHMAILALMLVLCVLLAALRFVLPEPSPLRPRLRLPLRAVVAGIALALGSNYLIGGAATFTPGGTTFLFARLVQDGFVKSYLDRNCPDAELALCRYRDTLPSDGDDWLWDDESPLPQLGGWRAFAPEGNRIIVGSLRQEPLAHLRAAALDTFAQLVAVQTGDGFEGVENWHTKWVLREHAPDSLAAFAASAEERSAIDFNLINWLDVPLALCATFALPVLVVLCWRRRASGTALALCVAAALLANAAICAIFSGSADRYQSRIVCIAVLAAGLAGYELLRSRRTVIAAPAIAPAATADAALAGSAAALVAQPEP